MQLLGLGWFYNGSRVTEITAGGITLEDGSHVAQNDVEVGRCGKSNGGTKEARGKARSSKRRKGRS
jgi:hypothetical protein